VPASAEVPLEEAGVVELVLEARAPAPGRVVQAEDPQALVLVQEGQAVQPEQAEQLGRQVQRELLVRLGLELEEEQQGQAPVLARVERLLVLEQVREELVRALALVVAAEVAVAVILVLVAEVLYRLQ
jgi:hypothetical protein